MAGQLREIRKRIKSVQSTQKITKSFELIAASRIVRAERRVHEARPFAERLQQVIRDLAATAGQVDHPILQTPRRPADGATSSSPPTAVSPARTTRTSCGCSSGRVARRRTRVTYAIGRKALAAFRFRKIAMEAEWSGFTDAPTFDARS